MEAPVPLADLRKEAYTALMSFLPLLSLMQNRQVTQGQTSGRIVRLQLLRAQIDG
jgi:hypothetical protein